MDDQQSQQPSQPDPLPGAQRTVASRQPALLERIGGRPMVERIVTAFYQLVEADPMVRDTIVQTFLASRGLARS